MIPLVGYGVGNAYVDGSGATFTASQMQPSIGGGVLLEASVVKKLKVEFGALYMVRGFKQSTPDQTVSFGSIQLPLSLKVYVLPAVALGIGAFFSYGLAAVSVGGGSASFDQAGYSIRDIGATASASLRFSLARPVGVILMVRGLYGGSNFSETPGLKINLFDLQGLVGIKFGE